MRMGILRTTPGSSALLKALLPPHVALDKAIGFPTSKIGGGSAYSIGSAVPFSL
jgi:hypothetical protein